MPLPKPSSHINWTDGAPAKVTEPTSGKKLLGWIASERPAFQFMNWLFFRTDEWIKYFESVLDDVVPGLAAFNDVQEVPVGVCDGTNALFVLTEEPYNSAALLVFVNSRLVPSTDYSLVGKNITFIPAAIPAIGSVIHAQYRIQLPFTGVPLSAPVGTTPKTEVITVTPLMVTNKAVTLTLAPYAPENTTLDLIDDGNEGFYSIDFTIAGTTLSWNGLGLDDGSIVAGERLRVKYFV